MIFNKLKLLVFALLVTFVSFKAHAQQPPSDTASLPYVVSEMVDLIVDGVENPTVQNEYVLKLKELNSFPQLTVSEQVGAQKMKELRKWVAENPKSIESLLIDRKKYFDKYNSQNQ